MRRSRHRTSLLRSSPRDEPSTTRPAEPQTEFCARSHSYVQDIFTIRPIAIKYRNGVAAPAIFCGGRRGAALRARVAQIASGSAGAFATDSGFGGGSRLQTFRSSSARREVECSRQAILWRMRGAFFERSVKRLHAPAAWLAVNQGRCASASPRMRHGAASFRIPSGASASSNPTRNCNFNLRRVWNSWKP